MDSVLHASRTESQQCPTDVLQRNYESDKHSECSLKSSEVAHSSESVGTDEENTLKLRNSARTGTVCSKGQRICCYQFCPSPMHSKKCALSHTAQLPHKRGGARWATALRLMLQCLSQTRNLYAVRSH
jgi:hypothetical protein